MNTISLRTICAGIAAAQIAGTVTAQQVMPQSPVGAIMAPVTTGFGVYTPYAVPDYTAVSGNDESQPLPDFSNVATPYKNFPWNTYFSLQERDMLVRGNMAARPESFGSFAQAYAAEPGAARAAVFVTPDAMLHGLRVATDEAYRQAERGKLIPMLAALLDELSARLGSQLSVEDNPKLAEGLTFALAVAQTARTLMDPAGYQPDQRVSDAVNAEVGYVIAAAGPGQSGIYAGRIIDYGIMKPAGYYNTDQTYAGYYRALIWLNQGLHIPAPATAKDYMAELRAAILIARTLDMMTANEGTGRAYSTLTETVAFFNGGRGDAVTMELLASLARGYFGRLINTSTAQLADDQSVIRFAAYADRTLPAYTLTTDGTRRFTFFPTLINDRTRLLHHMCTAIAEGTCFPDLFAWLAKPQADNPTGAGQNDLQGLLRRWYARFPAEEWVRSFEQTLTFTLLPLMGQYGVPDGTPPRFMRTENWRRRAKISALAGVAAFCRTTPLMPLPQNTPPGTPPAAQINNDLCSPGYVEPLPEAWARLASLAGYIRSGFAERASGSLISKKTEAKLRDIERVCAELMHIARYELNGKSCTADQLKLISTIPARIAAYETLTQSLPVSADGSAFVALSAERAGPETSVSAAAGQPLALYVITPRNDGVPGLMLTRGAIYGFRDRHAATAAGMAPFVDSARSFATDPARLRSYSTALPPALPEPRQQPAVHTHITFESSIVRRTTGELWFTVAAPQHTRYMDLATGVANRTGRMVLSGRMVHMENGEGYDVMRVDSLPVGHYLLRISDLSGTLVASGQFSVVQ